jgi:hypothetical protein
MRLKEEVIVAAPLPRILGSNFMKSKN